MRQVESERAEVGCAEVMRALAAYESSELERRRYLGFDRRLRLPVQDSEMSAHAAIGSMVASAEHYSVAVTMDKLHSTLPAQPRLAADALTELDKRIESRWPERVGAWRTWFGVDANASVDFRRLLAFVEARNSILHGRGRLTRQQLGSDAGRSVIDKLVSVDVQVILGRIKVDAQAVNTCALVAKGAMLWLDANLGQARPL